MSGLVERAEAAIGEAFQDRTGVAPWLARDLVTALEKVERENGRLREALEFYAKQYGLGARLASDGGMKARAALDDLETCSSANVKSRFWTTTAARTVAYDPASDYDVTGVLKEGAVKSTGHTFRRMLEGKITPERYVAVVKRWMNSWAKR